MRVDDGYLNNLFRLLKPTKFFIDILADNLKNFSKKALSY